MATSTPWNPQKAVGLHFQNGKLLNPIGGSGGSVGRSGFSSQPQPWNGPRNNNGLNVIGGYQNSGIQTDQFQQQYGRAPTALDYERRFGGLSPEHNQIGSLDEFYERNTLDPTSGTALIPSSHERLQQRAGLQQQGDFEQLGALENYQQAKQSGNPFAVQGARSNINSIRQGRQMLQSLTGQMPQAQSAPMAPTSTFTPIHATQDIMPQGPMMPFPSGPTSSGGINYSTGTPEGMFKGGEANEAHPYLVGEKGNEEFVGKDGSKQMIGMGGPEIRTFAESGRIIPHDRLPPRLKIAPIQGKYVGGPTKASDYDSTGFDGVLRDFGAMAPLVDSNQQAVTSAMRSSVPSNFGHPGRSQMMRMADNTLPPLMGPPSSMMSPPPIAAAQGDIPVASPSYNYENPEYTALSMPNVPQGTQPAYTVPPSALPPAPTAPTMSAGITPLPAGYGGSQFNYGTPYGKIGVSYGPKTTGSTINGLPASEAFQRLANAEGEANKFAQPEKDYIVPAKRYRQELTDQMRREKVAKESKGLKFS